MLERIITNAIAAYFGERLEKIEQRVEELDQRQLVLEMETIGAPQPKPDWTTFQRQALRGIPASELIVIDEEGA